MKHTSSISSAVMFCLIAGTPSALAQAPAPADAATIERGKALFSDVQYESTPYSSGYKLDSPEGWWNSGRDQRPARPNFGGLANYGPMIARHV